MALGSRNSKITFAEQVTPVFVSGHSCKESLGRLFVT
jgi:hypothetical protein